MSGPRVDAGIIITGEIKRLEMACDLAYAELSLNRTGELNDILIRVVEFIKSNKPYHCYEHDILYGEMEDLQDCCLTNGFDYIRLWDQDYDLDRGSAIYIAGWDQEKRICRCQPQPDLTQIRPALTATPDLIAQIEDLIASGLEPEDYLEATAATGPAPAGIPAQAPDSDLPLFRCLAESTWGANPGGAELSDQ